MNMRSKTVGVSLVLLALLTVAPTVPAAIVFTGDPYWANPPGENGGGGSSAITSTAPRSGNGSIEMFGDRTRFFGLGNPYSPASNLGLLSSLNTFVFDWAVAIGSTQGTTPGYTPALRLHIWDGSQRSELIWEGAYNGYGGANPPTQGTWYTSGNSDNFWQYKSGIGPTLIYDRSISEWQSIYSQNAYIAAVSVGVGSSAGSGYHAFADNITLGFGSTSTTYNFEPVPEPSTVIAGALLLLPFGVSAIRRFRTQN